MENESEKKNNNLEEESLPKNDEGNKSEEITIEEKLKLTEEKLLRSLAETENQRRRFEKELKDAFEFGGFNFAKESLAILDNLQRARNAILDDKDLKDSKDLSKFIKNLDVIEKDLVTIFEKNKIKKINSIREKFNPNLHQAMLEIEDSTVEPGTIIQEIQAGYMYADRLLRPSFVGVSKKKNAENDEKNQKKDT